MSHDNQEAIGPHTWRSRISSMLHMISVITSNVKNTKHSQISEETQYPVTIRQKANKRARGGTHNMELGYTKATVYTILS